MKKFMKLLITLAVLMLSVHQAQANDDWEIKLNVSPTSGNSPLTVSVQTVVDENQVPCDGSNLSLCKTWSDCRAAGGDQWFDDTCHNSSDSSSGKDSTTEVVTVTSAGQVWMDRNLGASRAATIFDDEQAYGDLYQWGRGADGHEKRTSGTNTTLSTSDTPEHSNFVLDTNSSLGDWRATQNDNLWQGTLGTNNPCPAGFRLPTITELDTERASWISSDSAGAFGSPLELVVAGYRNRSDGTIYYASSRGLYWSSTVDGTSALRLFFGTSSDVYSRNRAGGFSVRCLKD